MKTTRSFTGTAVRKVLATTLSTALLLSTAAPAAFAAEAKTVKVGFVMFLSGAAAGPFGVPARNAAELLVESLNKGSVPAPYNSVGFAGAKIEPVFVDEASKQKVADYTKLVQRDNVDMVVGYISSGSCKAIAPVAEKSKKLTVLFDCGTPQIFEDIIPNPKYVFRTGAHATMDNVGAARYLLATGTKADSIAGINQNYAWGQDSWRDFSESMKVLKSGVKVATEQFPKIYAGQYGSEISALLTKKPGIIHSSFWGGDMEALVLQGGARGIFSRAKVVLTCGETAMHRLKTQMPEGTVIGGRGPHGDLAPDSPLNSWFRKAYFDRFGTYPTYPSYKMAQALLGLKTAADKAGSTDQAKVIPALKGSTFTTPSGKVVMAISNGHQAIQETAYGTFKYDKASGKAMLTNVKRFKAECVNPPKGVKSIDWIKSGFKGANCD